jgi:hypothetical protein
MWKIAMALFMDTNANGQQANIPVYQKAGKVRILMPSM